MTERLSAERLAEIRKLMAVSFPHTRDAFSDLFAELAAVTRERDEARKDSVRLNWIAANEHSDDFRETIDAEIAKDVTLCD